MQALLLSLVFVVSVVSPTEPPTRFELVNTVWDPSYTEPSRFQTINEEWLTHPDGWDKVMLLPAAADKVYIQAAPVSEWYQGMGNGSSEVEAWRDLVASQFPAEQVENALCVIRSESGGNALARNPKSTASGGFQIMASIWSPYFGWSYEDLYVPELNVYAAARIWEMSGWVPWSPRTRRNCGL